MIIACPACATRYAVPDSAIGVEGRTVRCAKCRHSWFQEGPELDEAPSPSTADTQTPTPPAASPPVGATGEARAAPPSSWDEPAGEAPPPLPPEAAAARFVAQDREEADFAASESSFAHQPPFRPRRNPAKLWTLAAALFAVVAVGTIGFFVKFGPPDWLPFSLSLDHSTFGPARSDLVLDFPPNRQDRRTLPNGTEYFGVSGTVTNVGKERRTVPSVLIVLRDAQNRIVYSWDVAPPKRVLTPGEAVPIIEAVTDIPKSAKFAEIGWKPD